MQVAAASDPTHQQQNNDHEHNQTEAAAWPITPSGTVTPSWKRADEQKDKNNQQNG
jgi:hypothetical protein